MRLLLSRQHRDDRTENGSGGERGFSLLELVMVLVVIALVLAVTYPALLRGGAALHLRASGRDVLSTLR